MDWDQNDDDNDDDDNEGWNEPVEDIHGNPEKQSSKLNDREHFKKEDHGQVILHIDIDCFYAQVEMIRNPELRHKPLGIQQKNIVVTCNYPARERGVTKLMYIKDAKERCPELVLVSGEDLTHYREMSYKISGYLQKYCPLVERLGFDENFLDITELVNDRLVKIKSHDQPEVKGHVYEPDQIMDTCGCGCHRRLSVGSQVAADIREGLATELGITCCGGVAHNKLLSKLVAGTHKPNQQTTLYPEQTTTLMNSLKGVRSIPGIGHTTAKRLKDLAILTVQDLQNVDTTMLEEEFGGAAAGTMRKLSFGVDESTVTAFGLPQTLSDEDSFKKCSKMSEVKLKIHELLTSLLSRLLQDGRTPHTLRLTIRKLSKTYHRESRQCPIPSSVFNKLKQDTLPLVCSQLESLALGLFTKMVDVKQPFHLTLINVAFAKLDHRATNTIMEFFSPKSQKSASPSMQNVISTDRQRFADDRLKIADDRMKCTDDRMKCTDDRLKCTDDRLKITDDRLNITDDRLKCADDRLKITDDTQRCTDERQKCTDDTLNCTDSCIEQSFTHTESRTSTGELQNRTVCSVSRITTSPQQSDISSDRKGEHSSKNSPEKIGQFEHQSGLLKWLSKSPSKQSSTSQEGSQQMDISKTECDNQMNVGFNNPLQTDFKVKQKSVGFFRSVKRKSSDGVESLGCEPKEKKCKPSTSSVDVEEFLIPKDIDKDVFNELPLDIQREILCSTRLHVESNNNMNTKQSKMETKQSEILPASQSTDSNLISRVESKKVLNAYEFHRLLESSCTQSSISKNNQNKTDKSTPSSALSGPSCGSNVEITHIGVCTTRKDQTDIPPNIDKSVFLSLPADLQEELRTEWKIKTKTSPGTAKSNLHFKMPKPSASNNILSYFPKSNKR